ncbi:hypothetical protein T06_14120 [Trichinella sp. T6]|nr:hypothetical protein T06_14120 [Trichinella sp. T6]
MDDQLETAYEAKFSVLDMDVVKKAQGASKAAGPINEAEQKRQAELMKQASIAVQVFFLETNRCDPNGWLDEVKRVGDLSRLNACVVTEGTYDICSETMSSNEMLVSTLTSLAADLPDSQAPDDPLPTTHSMADLLRDGTPAGVGDRSRLIKRRLVEQSQVLTELTSMLINVC